MTEEPDNQLIVALDVDSPTRARELFTALRDVTTTFKIGLQLFTAAGPKFVSELVRDGARIFLDLKFHDIPNTVAAAGVEAARLGVFMFNLHGIGGSEMMRRTVDSVAEVSEREGLQRPKMIAVTVVTSADASTLSETGVGAGLEEQVARLARLASASGMDGVVSSPLEIALVRDAVSKPDFLIVTPSVRPTGASSHDQRRVLSPAEAKRAGATHLVVGRPILDAVDPVQAARAIVAELASE
jgi:orotidine-5'-phosphate decarboxylase